MTDKTPQNAAANLESYVHPFRVDGSKEFHLKLFRRDENGDLEKDEGKAIIEANRLKDPRR
ncbi:MAG: polyphosphate kinase 2 family protein, partial [Rhizobiales bacterium]|nr:polyphosphate kinase 2 family protein [Hyphomicrobiales bacterium]